LDPVSAMEVARQVASALEAAHRAGIVHRDLKPDNIFLVPDEAVVGGERIKVLDFGIAKLGRSTSSSVQTQSMMVFGTPRYMSPEQCKSAAHVDHRSDIYTLGCILFELLCGQPPFLGAPGELIARHVLVDPPAVASLVPEVPAPLAELVARMLAKEPEDRPQTMATVQRALESGGALAQGAAPTLPPHAVESSVPRMSTPGSFGVRPPVAPLPTEVDANPTTLGSAASSARVESPRRSRTALAVAGVVVVAGAIVAWLAFGRGSEPSTPIAEIAPPPPKLTVEPLPPPAKPEVAPDPGPAKTVPPPDPAPKHPVVKPPAVVKVALPAVVKKVDAPGMLVIAMKPACDVSIDGGPPVHAPQQLKLPAGKHRVTITNSELGIADTTTVEIKSGASESLERDYTDRITAKPPKKDATINPFAKGSGQ
ncbi:MAG TPA: serine/threonine-protein kinase, partial [Kofleriaceae bacterium]|nr:serine/threonine-protein kinase [Kofleriaceae bacterium]